MPDTKRCPRCAEHLPLSDFGARKSTRDGLAVYCRPCTNAIQREARARRNAGKAKDKPCRECQAPFVPSHPNAAFCSEDCRTTYQGRAKREAGAAWYRAHKSLQRRRNKAWKRANPDKCRAQRARIYANHKAQEREAHTAWVEANRPYYLAIQRDYSRRRAAVVQGKGRYAGSAPGAEAGGFVLVRYTYKAETFWRASPRDRRIGPNEAVVALYECVDGRWCVFAPAVAGPEVRRIVVKLTKSERGRRRMQEAA